MAGPFDLMPLYELTAGLPPGAALCGDTAYNDAKGEGLPAREGLRLGPIRKVNRPP